MKVLLTKTTSILWTSAGGREVIFVLSITQLCAVRTENEIDLVYYLCCYFMFYFVISLTIFK